MGLEGKQMCGCSKVCDNLQRANERKVDSIMGTSFQFLSILAASAKKGKPPDSGFDIKLRHIAIHLLTRNTMHFIYKNLKQYGS